MYRWQPPLTGFISEQVFIFAVLPSITQHPLHQLCLLSTDELACISQFLWGLFIKTEARVFVHSIRQHRRPWTLIHKLKAQLFLAGSISQLCVVIRARRGQELRVRGLYVISHQHVVTLHSNWGEAHVQVLLLFVLGPGLLQRVESLRLQRRRRVVLVLHVALKLTEGSVRLIVLPRIDDLRQSGVWLERTMNGLYSMMPLVWSHVCIAAMVSYSYLCIVSIFSLLLYVFQICKQLMVLLGRGLVVHTCCLTLINLRLVMQFLFNGTAQTYLVIEVVLHVIIIGSVFCLHLANHRFSFLDHRQLVSLHGLFVSFTSGMANELGWKFLGMSLFAHDKSA